MSIVCRPAQASEYDSIAECLERNGMPAWTRAEWRELWEDHPYRDEFSDVARGFVLESDGAIVGSISSLWVKYSLRGKNLRCTLAARAAVDPVHRAGSIRLFGQQILQPNVDLYINGSASVTASKVMESLKVNRVPQADNDLGLLWPAHGSGFARAALARRGVRFASALAWPVGLGLRAASAWKIRGSAKARLRCERIESFGAEFDELWARLRATSSRLVGFRDAATLRWRYGRFLRSKEATILTARRDGALVGYMVLMKTPHPTIGIVSNSVHDIQCADDDPSLVGSLLAAAWDTTRESGFDLLEWFGFSGRKRAVAERAAVLRHRLDVWQAFYLTRVAALRTELAQPDVWDFGPYDSD